MLAELTHTEVYIILCYDLVLYLERGSVVLVLLYFSFVFLIFLYLLYYDNLTIQI